MTEGIIVAWIHYMSVMVVLGASLGEHLLLKPQVIAPLFAAWMAHALF